MQDRKGRSSARDGTARFYSTQLAWGQVHALVRLAKCAFERFIGLASELKKASAQERLDWEIGICSTASVILDPWPTNS